MADPESLFSLEVIVESVENIVVSSHTPAIAFRLLDYPTLVIRSKVDGGATSPSCYKFNAGKSCLFKINKDKLRTSLQGTPLYIMLVDIWTKNTKLLASTTISLSKCFDNVWQSIERNGIDVPVVLGNKGVFELYNLMGTAVAMVRLDYRIFSLGGAINGHVKICEPLVKSPCQSENTRRKETDLSTTAIIDESLVTQNSSQKIENHLPIYHVEVESQTDFCNNEQSMQSNNKQSKPPKSTIGKGHVNIARPPPLYYNSQSSFTDSFIPMNSKSHGLTHEKRSVEKRDFTVDIEEALAMPRDCRTVSVQTANQAEVPLDYAAKVHPEKAQHSNLPLVNALLNELSLVKQNWMNTATQLEQCLDSNEPQAVNSQELHVHVPCTSQPDTKPPRCGVLKKCHLSPKGKIKKYATAKPSHKGVLVRRNPMKFKKSLLTCGTTKTQKLREAFNKKAASCSNVSTGDAEVRRPETNVEMGGNLVASKNIETKEVACQAQITNIHENKQEIEQLLKENKTNGNNTEFGHDREDLVVRDVGTQVVSHDDNLFPTQQEDEYSDEDNRNLFDNLPQVGDPIDIIQEDPNKMSDLKSQKYQEDMFHGSDVELSIHSTSCTDEELVSDKQLAFSNFPPPTRKNSRYSNDKHSNGEDKSSSIDIGLSKKNGKSHSHSKSLSNSSSEHNYSQDKFDSFTSDQVAENITSDNTGMSTIGTT